MRIRTFVFQTNICASRKFSASKSPTSCSCGTLAVIVMQKLLISIFFVFLLCPLIHGQNREILFSHFEYQFLNYSYLSAGIGFTPKGIKADSKYDKDQVSDIGISINYNKNLNNDNWGLSFQFCTHPINPKMLMNQMFTMGVEVNYKSVKNTSHFGFKPIIGLTYRFVSLLYEYNFDFYKITDERISQHELILRVRIPLLKK